jgi:hypothetical protein
MALSILPQEAFDAFRAAVAAPGKVSVGLARAIKASEGMIKDAD